MSLLVYVYNDRNYAAVVDAYVLVKSKQAPA